jgi:hypothetical protein
MHKTIFIFLSSLFCSSSIFATEQLTITHKSLDKLPSQEIGQVIKKFLPDTKNNAFPITWDYKANDNTIIWLHRPYIEEQLYDNSIVSTRKGIFRSHVLGKKATYLQNIKYELPWSVIYKGEMAKFGVKEIEFHPNLPGIDVIDSGMCFGTEYDNCDFNPIKSLKNAGVNSKMICRDPFGGGSNFEKVYLLTAVGKKPTYAIYSMSTGSGGSSSNFTLVLNTNQKDVCNSVK